MTSAESLSTRQAGAVALIAKLKPGTPEMLRATATQAALARHAPDAANLTSEELNRRAAAVAQRRDAQKRHSPAWITLDAEFDVLVAIEEDINPTTREEMGEGSNPREEPAAA